MLAVRSIKSTAVLIVLCLLIVALGCGDEPPSASDPHAPWPPTHPFPADRAEEQPLTLTLRWSCSDPDEDSLIYSLYLGTQIPPPLVDSSITDTTYDPGQLSLNRVYYWYVVARDPEGRSTSSCLWVFSTRAGFFYPLAVGNRWEYAGWLILFNFQPAGLANYRYPDTMYKNSIVEITRLERLLGSVPIHVFHETVVVEGLTPGNDTFHTDHYFAGTEDGLYYYGSSGTVVTGAVPLKIRPGEFISFKGRRFDSVKEILDLLSASVQAFEKIEVSANDEYPLKSLQYPLEVGSQWVYRGPRDFWLIHKRVTDWQSIDVPAGDFDCFEIQWLYDMDEDSQWDDDIEVFDYISGIGLVKRSITIRGLVMLDYDLDTLGTFDITDEFFMTGYQVE